MFLLCVFFCCFLRLPSFCLFGCFVPIRHTQWDSTSCCAFVHHTFFSISFDPKPLLPPLSYTITMQNSLKVLQSHFPSLGLLTRCNCIRLCVRHVKGIECQRKRHPSNFFHYVSQYNENDKSSALMMIAFDKLYIRKMNFKTAMRRHLVLSRHSYANHKRVSTYHSHTITTTKQK